LCQSSANFPSDPIGVEISTVRQSGPNCATVGRTAAQTLGGDRRPALLYVEEVRELVQANEGGGVGVEWGFEAGASEASGFPKYAG
jgi:hypothetical protein